MILVWVRTVEVENRKTETFRDKEEFLKYPATLKKIHSALNQGYGIAYIGDSEFEHIIVFLKYKRGDQAICTLIVRGTREEINDIQKDETVSFSMFK